MKKSLKALILIGLIFLYNCSENKKFKNEIVGKWEFVSMRPKIVETSDAVISTEIKEDYTNNANYAFKNLIEFLEDGKYIDLSQSLMNSSKSEGTYVIEKDNIIYTIYNDKSTKKIDLLNEDNLVLIENVTKLNEEKYPDTKIREVIVEITYKRIK